jgi:hypothetical protein
MMPIDRLRTERRLRRFPARGGDADPTAAHGDARSS